MTKETRFGRWYRCSIGKIIPGYAILTLILCWMINSLIYTGTQFLCANSKHYDLTTSFDRKVPFVKEWVWVYIICFGFWVINYILIAREGKEHWNRFVIAEMTSKVICGVFFVLIPTTNVRPEVIGNDISSVLMRFIYWVDRPSNLFPSIHCLVSWMCFIGIYSSKKIPKWYKVFSCLFAIAVCASTQFTKQHYIVDVFVGIAIAQICYVLIGKTRLYYTMINIFERVNTLVLGKIDSYESQ
ncbi:phosphatase PAP2 family protein [Lachnobacterium bovis]|uniref:PAP2 superfamily protein n=1 Tax=Lachnobacterium bovis TaxID=140626 RepID=A0A1H9P4G3_9FIRM|nr:phosphatase PAP2 family protein [Lachnobacterium bovis]SER43078.1 PAP2 superfamily protein [Lachnobacterium bovis]